MLPNALQIKSELDAKRALFDATSSAENPEAARQTIVNILTQIGMKIDDARKSQIEAPTFVDYRVDPVLLAHPLAVLMRQYLTAVGYSLQENSETGQVNISW